MFDCKRLFFGCTLLAFVGNVASCSSGTDSDQDYGMIQAPLKAWCTAKVIGKGNKDVETDYLPRVIRCENGNAPLEALKAQAVAARSYLYYRMNGSGEIADGTSDQVYGCKGDPKAIHYQAVKETSGQVLQYQGVQVAAFYVAGAIPSAASCVAAPGDNDYSNTEKYVTYNKGKSGDNLTQTTLGWVNKGNLANRGCKSQNGASCLAKQGWNYKDIIKFYYGNDIELLTAKGQCVDNTECECTPNDTETTACNGSGHDDKCNVKTRICNSDCQWGDYGACEAPADTCEPGKDETRKCGFCGTQSRSCSDQCQWNEWGTCESQGVCETGDIDEVGCGKCGVRQRTCTANCVWSGYSECTNEGECDPGITSVMGCGDCKYQVNSCDEKCSWSEYSECTELSADSPLTACHSGQPGTCTPGHLVCIDNEVTCAVIHEPSDEVCDGLDNDCDGIVDNNAEELSDPPPDLAARIKTIDVPEALIQGTAKTVTVTFENAGNISWSPGDISLHALGFNDGSTSLFWDASWIDEKTVTDLNAPVDPGETATFTFVISTSNDFEDRLQAMCSDCEWKGEWQLEETFVLVEKSAGQLKCPSPNATLSVLIYDPALSDGRPHNTSSSDSSDATGSSESDSSAPTITSTVSSGQSTDDGGCSTQARQPSGHSRSIPVVLMLFLATLAILRRLQTH